MTKKALAQRIRRRLRHWEGSMLTVKTANEIIEVIEKAIGKLPLEEKNNVKTKRL